MSHPARDAVVVLHVLRRRAGSVKRREEGGGRGDLDAMDDETWQSELERSRNLANTIDITNRVNRFTASNKFTYNAGNNIIANFTTGVDFRSFVQQRNDTNEMQIYQGTIPEGSADRATLDRMVRNNFTLTTDFNLTHRGALDNFEFVTIVGAQFFRKSDRQNLVSGSGGVDGSVSVNTFPTKTSEDFVLENANYGMYLLENIGIYNVAFLEFGGRLDYNTAAGKNSDAIFLPKFGITYNISDHDFYEGSSISNIVSSIKLRANYGEATNFAGAFSGDRTFALESFLGQPAFRFANPGNPDLKSEIDSWLLSIKQKPDFRVIYNRYFKNNRSQRIRAQSEYSSISKKAISPYDDIIRDAAEETHLDWRLLTALIYQESRFDPKSESWMGAKGLMQVTDRVADDYDVDNIFNPDQNVLAGTRHLQWLNAYWEDKITDEDERLKFVIGSYNVGHGHILDARKLTEKYGGDPNKWDGNVADYLLLKSQEKYFTDPVVVYGYCRGREPVNYVDNIFDRFDQYKLFFDKQETEVATSS